MFVYFSLFDLIKLDLSFIVNQVIKNNVFPIVFPSAHTTLSRTKSYSCSHNRNLIADQSIKCNMLSLRLILKIYSVSACNKIKCFETSYKTKTLYGTTLTPSLFKFTFNKIVLISFNNKKSIVLVCSDPTYQRIRISMYLYKSFHHF